MDIRLVRYMRKGVLTGYQFYGPSGEKLPDPSLAIAALEVVKEHLRMTLIEPLDAILKKEKLEQGILAREAKDAEMYVNTHYIGHPQDPVGRAAWLDHMELTRRVGWADEDMQWRRRLINRENALLINIALVQLGMKKLLRLVNF